MITGPALILTIFMLVVYAIGVFFTFRSLAAALKSTVWLLFLSVFWPIWWIVFGFMFLFVTLADVHERMQSRG